MAGRKLDAAHFRTGDVRDAVNRRELVVDERVIALEQFEHASIFADDVVKVRIHLLLHRGADFRVQLGARRHARAPAKTKAPPADPSATKTCAPGARPTSAEPC